MTTLKTDLMHALDPVLFARDALGFSADDWQARVLRWNGRRLLLNCSRQSGKSTTTAIKALHTALYTPRALVLMVSPSQRQSSELFRKVLDFLIKLNVRPTLVEDNKLSIKFEHGARIVSLPSSEATIRGFSGATLIVEDESSRVADELYYAIRPMIAVSGGRLLLMSTPFGKRGHFFEEWMKGDASWERIKVTATECSRIPADFLEEEKRSIGDWWFKQEYLCEFVETTEQVFSYELVMAAIDPEVKPLFDVTPTERGANDAATETTVEPLFRR